MDDESSKGQYRGGVGKVTSSTEAKENMGRGFVRAAKDHIGERANQTEWRASARLAKSMPSEGPTPREIGMVKEENPQDWKVMQASGMSEADIYNALKDR